MSDRDYPRVRLSQTQRARRRLRRPRSCESEEGWACAASGGFQSEPLRGQWVTISRVDCRSSRRQAGPRRLSSAGVAWRNRTMRHRRYVRWTKSYQGGAASWGVRPGLPASKPRMCSMRYLVHRRSGLGMLRASRPRQRSPPCAHRLVSGSAHFTKPIPARTGG